MLTQEAFLATVESFLERSGMKPTVFGKEAVGDPNLVRDLREGRSPGLRTAERVTNFIEARQPQSEVSAEAS